MFDFDDLEDVEPSPNVEDEVEQAVARLQDERFTVRRDACKSLAALGPLVARCAELLQSLLSKEEDYEVQKAAVAALQSMCEAGVHPLQSLCSHRDLGLKRIVEKALQEMKKCGIHIPVQPPSNAKQTSSMEREELRSTKLKLRQEERERRPAKPKLRQEVVVSIGNKQAETAQLEVVEAEVHDTTIEYPWPCVLFRIFTDVLPMRVEKHSMTPQELIHIWEHEWRVPYASRIKFFASEDADKKCLHPHQDIVPGSPCEVKLHAGVGSILEGLAVALKRYGRMDCQEFQSEKKHQEQKKTMAADIRKRDDAREMHHWQELGIQREQRLATPEDAERRRLLRIREATPWKLKETDTTKPSTNRSVLTPYS